MSQPLANGLGRLWRLTRKELSESLRDRRTILTLVLMPILLYPLLGMTFQYVMLHSHVENAKRDYKIAFASEEEARPLLEAWRVGRQILVNRHGEAVEPGKQPPLNPYLDPLPELIPLVLADPDEAVRQGKADVAVRTVPPGSARIDLRRPVAINLLLSYRTGSTYGPEAVRYLEVLSNDYNALLLERKLAQAGVRQRGHALWVRAVKVPDETGQRSSLVPVLIPLVLILMTMTGAVYPAIDLTAGERERNTLEILIAAPIPRLSVLLAKYTAVLTVAMLTALVNLGSMVLTLQVTGIGPALFGEKLGVGALVQVLVLLVLFAAFFSAVVLALTSFARSFKEAQAYLIPLMLFCLTPGMLAMIPGLSLQGPLAVVPLVNIVLLARDVFTGTSTPVLTAIVVSANLVYALAAVALAARLFGTEAVLTSEGSGWGDFFRRSPQARPRAEAASAMLCLALMFPVYFLLNNGLARLGAVDLLLRFLIAASAQVLLFAGFPLVAAWLGRVRFQSGFRLHRPTWSALAAALLLGISLWPFVHELVLLQNALGLSSLREEYHEKMRETLVLWRTASPWLLVLVLAVTPAVLEELFFRGFLLEALAPAPGSMGRAVFSTAGLFALFHLLVTDSLAIERLLPSFLLGLVLGWLAVRGGSVLPGMMLHALHNGLLVLLGYYELRLVEMGWLVEGQEHLPPAVLAGAGVLALIGAGILLGTRSANAEPSGDPAMKT